MAFVHDHTFKLAAAPAAVFAALTDAAALTTWFAEHVEVGRGVGDAYRFWGRHTLATPTPSQATQQIHTFDADRQLAYRWSIADVFTDVSLTLTAVEGESRLLVRHEVHAPLPFPRERELLDDFWRLSIGNLSAFLAGGDGIVRPDFSDPAPEVRQSLLIDAPPATVFHALITPSLVNEWFGSKAAEIEPHVGGRYSVGWQYQIDGRDVTGGPTRILDYEQDVRLVLDWPDWRGDASVTGQTITFLLQPEGRGTRLTFVHAGFSRTTDISDYPFGWVWFVGELKRVAEAATG